MTDPSLSFVAQLRALAAEAPDRPMITVGETTLTRGEVMARADRLARYFVSVGVETGDYVTLVLPNSVELLIGDIAAWIAGAAPQPLSPKIAPNELEAIIEITAPKVIVGDLEVPGIPSVPATLDVPDPGGELPERVAPYWKAPTSGGSTGRPKVIVANQPALFGEVSAFADILGLTGRTSLITAPLSHNGPNISALLTILTGGHAVVLRRFDAEEALKTIERHRIQWIYAVPTIMGRILKLDDAVRLSYDVSSVEFLMHMAAPCPPAVKQAFISWLGPEKILELYAGTEVQAVTVLDGKEWLAHPGSVGQVKIGEIEIRDDDNNPVSTGTVGRVWLRRGPDAPAPYFYLGATARAADGGWETLGDLGHLDADGYLYLSDRDTDMILVGGSNVYPAEVEAAILEHPLVSDACVIGLPHDDLGSAPHALVRTTGPVTQDEIAAFVAERLTTYKCPKTWEFVDHALRDDAGKVRRSSLRAERLPR